MVMAFYHQYTHSGNKDPFHLTSAKLPAVVKHDEVLVKIHSASLNPIDIVVYNSSYWPLLSRKKGTGRDYSGVVECVGSKVSAAYGIKQGDRVVGLYRHFFSEGTMAEYVLLKPFKDDCALSKVPSGMTMEEAASYPLVLLTAYSMINGHNLEGSKILVLGGATSVGRYLVQLAYQAGAGAIVTTNGTRSNELVKSLGSTLQIDYNQNLRTPVLAAAKSGPFNYIYDCTGNNDLFGIMAQVLDVKRNGYVTIVGDRHYNYDREHGLALVSSLFKSKTRQLASSLGVLGYNYRYVMMFPRKSWFDEAYRLFSEGKLVPYVDSVFSFEEFPKAWEKLSSGKVSGKVVVNVATEN
ncbi:hypothetical protein DICA2_F38446 [Diutina catenulata]